MKLRITKITVYPLAGGMQEVVKTVDDPRIGTVKDKTVMTMTAIGKYMAQKGWYYNGRRNGGYQYLPSSKATVLTITTEDAS